MSTEYNNIQNTNIFREMKTNKNVTDGVTIVIIVFTTSKAECF